MPPPPLQVTQVLIKLGERFTPARLDALIDEVAATARRTLTSRLLPRNGNYYPTNLNGFT